MAVISTLKLILAPFLIILFNILFNLQNFGLDYLEYDVSLAQSAMPMAVTNFVISKQYKIEEEFVANSVVVTTLISILTIPIVLTLFV
jgi:predicted permease